MSVLGTYVLDHTLRGECRCGLCIDVAGTDQPPGHTVDMVFFEVAAVGEPDGETFRRLTAEHTSVFGLGTDDPLDGAEHNYLWLGGWIGNQGLAMQYMALGVLLGIFDLLSPDTLFGDLADDLRTKLAQAGYLAVQAHRDRSPSTPTPKETPAL